MEIENYFYKVKIMLYAHKAQHFLRYVPSDKAFQCRDGQVCICLEDLKEALKEMDEDTFNHHHQGEINDFAAWIRDIIEDYYLSLGMEAAQHKNDALERLQERLNHWDRQLDRLADQLTHSEV